MQLSCDRAEIAALDEMTLRKEIDDRRLALRHWRDQWGDDRCWVDDYVIHAFVRGVVVAPIVPFNYDEVMAKCTQFYRCRRAEHPDPMPVNAISDPTHWDDDLGPMDHLALTNELGRIQEYIAEHVAKGANRTVEDDRRLLSVLPENLPGDWRLPPEDHFLGETRSPEAGCPAFWRSHDGCGPECNPHQWGPCKKS